MNNPKTRQQWILDELKISPTISYVEMFAKYSQKFSISRRTFDKDWNKANIAFNEYREVIEKAKLEQSIETEKEAVKRNILSKLDAMEILSNMAYSAEKDADRRNAIETLAKFEGWNAPTKQETDINFSKDVVINIGE